jgi:hypothetical protein
MRSYWQSARASAIAPRCVCVCLCARACVCVRACVSLRAWVRRACLIIPSPPTPHQFVAQLAVPVFVVPTTSLPEPPPSYAQVDGLMPLPTAPPMPVGRVLPACLRLGVYRAYACPWVWDSGVMR